MTTAVRRRLDEVKASKGTIEASLKSLSNKRGDKYRMVIRDDGTFECSCPQNQHRGVFCKHLKRLNNLIQEKHMAKNAATKLRDKTYRGTHMRDSRGVYAWKDERFPSITTLLKVLDKPALPRWAAKSVAEHVAEFVSVTAAKESLGWKSIQQYLSNTDELKQVPWKYAEKRRDIGSTLHDIAEQIAGGSKINPGVFADDIRPLVESYLDFCNVEKPEYHAMETGCFNRTIGYACTLDTILKMPRFGEALVICDYKTGKDVYAEAIIQTNAQRVCEFIGLKDGTELKMPKCERNLVLLVQETGWKLVECPIIPNVKVILRALVTLYNHNKAGLEPIQLTAMETN